MNLVAYQVRHGFGEPIGADILECCGMRFASAGLLHYYCPRQVPVAAGFHGDHVWDDGDLLKETLIVAIRIVCLDLYNLW